MKIIVIFFSIIFLFSCDENILKLKNKKESTSDKLNLKFLPVNSTLIGFVDFNKIIKNDWFIKLIKDGALLNKVDISFDETTLLSFFLDIDNLISKKEIRGALTLKNVNLSVKDIKKKQKYNGIKVNILDQNISFSVIENNFMIGTSLELNKQIDIHLGKLKTLASTPKNKSFKDIVSKLPIKSFLKIAFIPSERFENLLQKISVTRYKLSNFLNNLYAISMGVEIEDQQVVITSVVNSNDSGINELNEFVLNYINKSKNNISNLKILYFLSKTKIEKKNNFLYTKTVLPSDKFIEMMIYWNDL